MNTEPSLSALNSRVEVLERTVAELTERLKRAESISSGEQALEVRRLIVRSAGSKRCLMLDAGAEEAGIYLYDEEEKLRECMTVSKTGGQVELRNAAGEQVVMLCETSSGTGGGGNFYVATAAGEPCVALRSGETGGILTLVNKDGHARVAISGEGDGGKVFVSNTENHYSGIFAADEHGGTLQLHERSGEIMVTVGATSDAGLLALHGPHGERAVVLAATEEQGGTVAFYDVEGEIRSVLP
jgi:hypothetical protein